MSEVSDSNMEGASLAAPAAPTAPAAAAAAAAAGLNSNVLRFRSSCLAFLEKFQ